MTKTTKIVLGWWILGTLLLSGLFFAFYESKLFGFDNSLLVLGGSALVLAIILYEVKVHISMMLLFLSELCHIGANLLTSAEEFKPNAEFLIACVGVFVAIYLVIRTLRKSNKNLTLSNIVKQQIKPYNVPLMVKIMLLAGMISVIFTVALSYMPTYGSAAWVSVIYMMLPSFILLVSIVPIKEVVYLRVVYYVMWIMIIQMASTIGTASLVSMVEPVVYLVSVVFGRIYSLSIKQIEKESAEV